MMKSVIIFTEGHIFTNFIIILSPPNLLCRCSSVLLQRCCGGAFASSCGEIVPARCILWSQPKNPGCVSSSTSKGPSWKANLPLSPKTRGETSSWSSHWKRPHSSSGNYLNAFKEDWILLKSLTGSCRDFLFSGLHQATIDAFHHNIRSAKFSKTIVFQSESDAYCLFDWFMYIFL